MVLEIRLQLFTSVRHEPLSVLVLTLNIE